MRRAFVIIGALIAASLAAGSAELILTYGTVAPCGILRERERQHSVLHVEKFGAFNPTAVPDALLDALIAQKYGTLTTERCIRILINEPM